MVLTELPCPERASGERAVAFSPDIRVTEERDCGEAPDPWPERTGEGLSISSRWKDLAGANWRESRSLK